MRNLEAQQARVARYHLRATLADMGVNPRMADGGNWRPPKRHGGGMPAFVPTQEMQHMVMVMRSNGDSQKVIARALRISVPTLNRYFKDELRHGFEDVKSRVQAAVVRSALGGNIAAQRFWLLKNCPEWRVVKDEVPPDPSTPFGGSETVRFYMPPNGRDQPDEDDEPPIIEGTAEAA